MADVLVFVCEAVHRFEQIRSVIINKLLKVFSSIKAVRIHHAAMWILDEYSTSMEDIQNVMMQIRQSICNVPCIDNELERISGDGKEDKDDMMQKSIAKLVISDGTYATQSAFHTNLSTNKTKHHC